MIHILSYPMLQVVSYWGVCVNFFIIYRNNPPKLSKVIIAIFVDATKLHRPIVASMSI